MSFSPEELERYARHIVLSGVGGAGQQKIKASRVLVIGAGGLGSPVLQYLAAAGVGTLGVVDDDIVSLSNLQRQIIHQTRMVGETKTKSAAQSVDRLNPHVNFFQHQERIETGNAGKLITNYDIVVDGSDNFETRFLVAEQCERFAKPLVSAAVGQFDGNITVLKPYETDEEGNLNPRYRDLFPEKPEDRTLATCEEAGILGALTGVIGSLQALEVLKEITGVGEGLVGKLLLFDGKAMRFETIHYSRNQD